MKKYKALTIKKQFVLASEDQKEIGRIVETNKFFSSGYYIILNSRSYDIKNVGFLKNDAELYYSKGVVYLQICKRRESSNPEMLECIISNWIKPTSYLKKESC
ncbi:hypothetical protein BN1195_01144 [Chryseobacterium oranimense G311]|uniref:hypothetical protein n=1 Tax=Chryseobacterium oranimense TaxID=421058 RepID=UPI000533B607|nr:hypothetical protein [Chryseobacterium oranimense]CEJ68853.1 hypothetical protein BN1195_01144 [Chryseobacterium oranimense G311]